MSSGLSAYFLYFLLFTRLCVNRDTDKYMKTVNLLRFNVLCCIYVLNRPLPPPHSQRTEGSYRKNGVAGAVLLYVPGLWLVEIEQKNNEEQHSPINEGVFVHRSSYLYLQKTTFLSSGFWFYEL